MALRWVHVQRIVSRANPRERMRAVTLTAFGKETRAIVVRCIVAGGFYGLLLPSADDIAANTTTLQCAFILHEYAVGVCTFRTYERFIDGRTMAETEVHFVPDTDAVRLATEEDVQRWIDTLEQSAECMASGLLKLYSFDQWHDELSASTAIDFSATPDSELLFNALLEFRHDPTLGANLRSKITRASITVLMATCLLHHVSGWRLITRSSWVTLLCDLLVQLGLNGAQYIAAISRSADNTGRVEMSFEDAVRHRISLKAGRLSRGVLTFKPTIDALSIDLEIKLKQDASDIVSRVEALLDPLPPNITEGYSSRNLLEYRDSVDAAMHAVYLHTDVHRIPASMLASRNTAEANSIARLDRISDLPAHLRALMKLEAKQTVRELASGVCAFMLSEQAVEEYLARVSLQSNGKQRRREVADLIRSAKKNIRSPKALVASIHKKTYALLETK